MKRPFNISKKTANLFFGIGISLLVTLQAIYAPSYLDVQPDKTEQGEESHSQESTVSSTQAIPNSSSQINVGFDSYLLEEVTFDEEGEENHGSGKVVTTRLHKAMRVLLQRIISPNAP